MSQNFRLFHVSNLSVRNFRFFLLMYTGSSDDSEPVAYQGDIGTDLARSIRRASVSVPVDVMSEVCINLNCPGMSGVCLSDLSLDNTTPGCTMPLILSDIISGFQGSCSVMYLVRYYVDSRPCAYIQLQPVAASDFQASVHRYCSDCRGVQVCLRLRILLLHDYGCADHSL